MCKIHPILFNTDMVWAILSGRKTETRRLVKPQPRKSMVHKLGYCVDGDKEDIGKYGFGSHECGGHVQYVKPPCQPGDILYVRETWSEWTGGYLYKAWTGLHQPGIDGLEKWHPSIHMPKEAARIWLKVTNFRVERLQDIDNNGIVAEGLEIGCDFEEIWDSVIKKADIGCYGWDSNPWVWVIEFRRCKKPESQQYGW